MRGVAGYPRGVQHGTDDPTARRDPVSPALLARHYHQLRTSRGTVLLGEPPADDLAPRLDSSWFVNGCPLDPDGAVEAIRVRHGYASRAAALRALRTARDALDRGDPAAGVLRELV